MHYWFKTQSSHKSHFNRFSFSYLESRFGHWWHDDYIWKGTGGWFHNAFYESWWVLKIKCINLIRLQTLDSYACKIFSTRLTILYRLDINLVPPLSTSGVSILFKKPMKKPPNLFSFMSPLSLDVWIYMATAYLGVSVLLFILARYCN